MLLLREAWVIHMFQVKVWWTALIAHSLNNTLKTISRAQPGLWGAFPTTGRCLLLVYQSAIIASLCACWPQVPTSLQIADVGRSRLARLIDTVNWLAARPNHSPSPTLVVSNFPLTMNIFIERNRSQGLYFLAREFLDHLDTMDVLTALLLD